MTQSKEPPTLIVYKAEATELSVRPDLIPIAFTVVVAATEIAVEYSVLEADGVEPSIV